MSTHLIEDTATATSGVSRRALWVAVAVLTLLALGLGSMLVLRHPQDPVLTGPTGGLAASDSEPTILAQAPPTDWQRVDLPRAVLWIPVSPEVGPMVAAAGKWNGWSQSPAGAVFAAQTIFSGFGLDNLEAREYLSDRVVGYPEYLDQQLNARAPDGQAPKVVTKVTGFRVDEYAADTATVTVRVAASTGGDMVESATTYRMQWVDGDWKTLMTPSTRPEITSPPTGAFVDWMSP